MSALDQKQTLPHARVMSALPPIADIDRARHAVRFVPIADIRDLSTKLRDQILLSMLARATAFGARQAHHVGRIFLKLK
jgi:hypothetical protein